MAKKRHKSTIYRIRQIVEITRQHYEEGNLSKCYRAVWRRHIEPRFGIDYRTYLRYLNVSDTLPKAYQPTLFD